MTIAQLYAIFGVPLIALAAVGCAILLVRRSARQVDAMDVGGQRKIAER